MPPRKGTPWSEKRRAAFTQEVRDRMSRANRGRVPWNKGERLDGGPPLSRAKRLLWDECRRAYRNALRSGVLVRPETCERCKSVQRVTGHHDDPRQPTIVRWLCRRCRIAVTTQVNSSSSERETVALSSLTSHKTRDVSQ